MVASVTDVRAYKTSRAFHPTDAASCLFDGITVRLDKRPKIGPDNSVIADVRITTEPQKFVVTSVAKIRIDVPFKSK